ncbi:MAG TPA: hypothetical protein VNO50_08040 [Pyrinomonadaceae bacterium]|nr:hypothetical protein [Pyrinomonadaceae bacterium]
MNFQTGKTRRRTEIKLLTAGPLFIAALAIVFFPAELSAQRKSRAVKPKPKTNVASELAKSAKELARLQEEFIKATKEYKDNLQKLKASYEKDVTRAEVELTKSKDLFAAGLIAKKDLEASEGAVAQAKDKVAEVDRSSAVADTQIADTLLEAEAEAKLRTSKPIPKGSTVSTAAMIRFNGGGAWVLSDAWKVQRFFQQAFQKPLPISVFGQGAIHVRWRLDHNNSMDVSLHPDGREGQALLGFLRSNGIPFLAFRQAIPGTATGPHIHIGRPSHRY